MKKLIPMATICGLLLSACATPQNQDLRFAWWGGKTRNEATQQVISLFTEKNPGTQIKGEFSPWPGYQEHYTNQFIRTMDPDIAQINWAWISSYSKDGNGYYDLNQDGLINKDDFKDQTWQTGLKNGKLNAIPLSYTSRVYLWNKTTWDKAGLPLPQTWDDLLNAGKIFKERLGRDYYPIDCELYDRTMMAHAYIQQKTGKPWIDPHENKVALTQSETLEWVKFFNRLEESEACSSLSYRNERSGQADRPTEQQIDWVTGKWAGNYAWDVALRLRTMTPPKSMFFAVGPFIMLPNAKSSGVFGRPGLMLAVSKKTKNPQLAARFINWVATDIEAAKILKADRGIPLSITQRKFLIENRLLSDLEISASTQASTQTMDLPNPHFESTRIQALLREIFEQVAMHRITPEDAANRLVSDANEILKRLR